MAYSTRSKMSVKLVSQGALGCDVLCDNGKEKNVHTVVKRIPYGLDFEMVNGDFNNYMVRATLVYDDETSSEVVSVKQKAFAYEGRVADGGALYHMTASFFVLSSNYEEMNFRVKFELMKNGVCAALVFSHPVRVISKPQVYRNKLKKQRANRAECVKVGVKRRRVTATDGDIALLHDKVDALQQSLTELLSQPKRQRLSEQTDSVNAMGVATKVAEQGASEEELLERALQVALDRHAALSQGGSDFMPRVMGSLLKRNGSGALYDLTCRMFASLPPLPDLGPLPQGELCVQQTAEKNFESGILLSQESVADADTDTDDEGVHSERVESDSGESEPESKYAKSLVRTFSQLLAHSSFRY